MTFNLQNVYGVEITQEQKSLLDTDFTIKELYDSAKGMKKNKVPGISGLTLEFYLTFWEDLSEMLFEMYKECHRVGLLNMSARKGLMSLIPKKGRDKRKISNLRPLTLLEIEYKILARTFALRMKTVLPNIIGDYQTGFMEGRNIGTNLTQTVDLISHVNHTGKEALIISVTGKV